MTPSEFDWQLSVPFYVSHSTKNLFVDEEIDADDPHREKKLEAYHYWQDLRSHSLPIDFGHVIEDQDNTTLSQQIACGGGACELSLVF